MRDAPHSGRNQTGIGTENTCATSLSAHFLHRHGTDVIFFELFNVNLTTWAALCVLHRHNLLQLDRVKVRRIQHFTVHAPGRVFSNFFYSLSRRDSLSARLNSPHEWHRHQFDLQSLGVVGWMFQDFRSVKGGKRVGCKCVIRSVKQPPWMAQAQV